ncbi:MAG: glutathione synthase [Gammaproteobacteria bacterium]|nr:glutathione synthase [Gammaproteobacteria bacterium]
MTIKLGVVMDDIASINFKKDSTLAMLWEADKRGWEIYYFEQGDLFLRDGVAYGNSHLLSVYHDEIKWFEFESAKQIPLSDLNVILMRKDPPFDKNYIYTTYILENAESAGTLVLNKPQSLRDANEKIYATLFPQCCSPAIVTSDMRLLKEFYAEHEDIVCKPLDAMGGASIFHLRVGDPNTAVVFETLTQYGTQFIVAQKYIPEITKGDKRILMINGEPVPFALARIPAKGEWRGNLAAGAVGVAQPLSENDLWICNQVGPVLREKGLYFVGLDVIGNYLTEVNVTSPTCIRELDEQCDLNIAAQFLDCVESLLSSPD